MYVYALSSSTCITLTEGPQNTDSESEQAVCVWCVCGCGVCVCVCGVCVCVGVCVGGCECVWGVCVCGCVWYMTEFDVKQSYQTKADLIMIMFKPLPPENDNELCMNLYWA